MDRRNDELDRLRWQSVSVRLMLTLLARAPPDGKTSCTILIRWTHRSLSARLCVRSAIPVPLPGLEASIFVGGVYVKRLLVRVVLIGSSITGLLLAGGASRIWR